ncbi:MAG: hypothetical protein RSC48_05960 [Anaerorhabdus sp.]
MVIDKRLQGVKEVKETSNYEEVNALVRERWVLICIYLSNEKLMYLLGRVG